MIDPIASPCSLESSCRQQVFHGLGVACTADARLRQFGPAAVPERHQQGEQHGFRPLPAMPRDSEASSFLIA